MTTRSRARPPFMIAFWKVSKRVSSMEKAQVGRGLAPLGVQSLLPGLGKNSKRSDFAVEQGK